MSVIDLAGPRREAAAREVERTVRFLLRRSYPTNLLVRRREDDLVQETLLAAVTKARRIAEGAAPPIENSDAWLCRVALNAARRIWRREGGTKEGEELDGLHLPSPEQLSPEERMTLRRALEQLDIACRKLLIDREVVGFAREEMAAALGVSSNTLGVRLHRCRRRLLELFSGGSPAPAT